MSIKDILVFLDDGAANAERVNAAFQLAKIHNAELTAVALASLKPLHAKLDDDDSISQVSEKLANQLIESYTRSATSAGLAINTILISGDATTSAQKTAHYARNTDLVILGQPDPASDNFSRLQEFSREVMLFSGRPVMFIPYIGTKKFPGNKAMIAWDGTPAATRAVHDAIPLLARLEETIILVVESQKQLELKNEVLVGGLAKHLSKHDVNSTIRRVNPGDNNVPTVILNQIIENDIDLLILGGYGTPTLKQKIFGGVSRTLLSSMIVPVVMSH